MSKKKWSLEEALEKVRPNKVRGKLSKDFNFNPKPILPDHEITNEMLDESYLIMAKIIRIHGDKYLPLFKRLQAEREGRAENERLFNIAIEISTKEFNPHDS